MAVAVPGTGTGGTVYRRNGAGWLLLPGAPFTDVIDMTIATSGDLIAIGAGGAGWVCATYPSSSSPPQPWITLGTGIGAALRVWEDVDTVIVAGAVAPPGGSAFSGLGRWNGSSWTWPPMPAGSVVTTVDRHGLGIVVGGQFVIGNATNLAFWNGRGTWTPIPGTLAPTPVSHVLRLRNEDLVVVHNPSSGSPGSVGRWQHPSSWTVMANAVNGDIRDAFELPDGDVVVAGNFTVIDGVATAGLARWNGTFWLPLASSTTPAGQTVQQATWLREGQILASGLFTSIDGITTNGLCTLGTPSPASEVVLGGCISGNYLLTTRARAWVGGRYEGLVTGWPTTLGQPTVQVFGLTPSGITLPGGALCPTCVLLPFPDVITSPVAQDGLFGVPVTFDLPDAPFLTGLMLYYQVVALANPWPCFLATNGLLLTVGRY